MGDSEIKRISGREGLGDEVHEKHGTTLKQKVPEKECETKCLFFFKFGETLISNVPYITSGGRICCKDCFCSQYDCALHLAGLFIYISLS